MTDGFVDGDGQGALAPIINKTGLPNTLRGKAQRVFLRFLAGSLAHPYIREVRQNLDDMEARSRINMIVAEELGRQAIADPAFMERTKARLLGDALHKQENLEAVLVSANQKIDEADDGEMEGDDKAEPSQDWINSFTREAELASSEELRKRLADLLAGEIKRPGAFSRSTIRTIAEMDSELIDNFRQITRIRLNDAIPIDATWNSGSKFAMGSMLEDASLISGILGMTHKTIKFNEKGDGFLVFDERALILKGTPNLEKQFSVWLITKVGREILSLMPPTSQMAGLKKAFECIEKSDIKSAYLGRVMNEGTFVTHDEQLWPEPKSFNIPTGSYPGFGSS